jgi:galactonate dehydratase
MRQAARIADLVARFAAIRETVGWQIDLGVELHRNMSAGDAVMLCGELARCGRCSSRTRSRPTAWRLCGRSPPRSRCRSRRASATRRSGSSPSTSSARASLHPPDVGIAGGITHVKKICALAEAFHAGVLPHAVPSGPVGGGGTRPARHVRAQLGAQEHVPQDAPRGPTSSTRDRGA